MRSRLAAVESDLAAVESELRFRRDDRMHYFGHAFSGSHDSISSAVKSALRVTYIENCCLFCGRSMPDVSTVSKAHLVASLRGFHYNAFQPPAYDSAFNPNSARNFILLCGSKGVFDSCHHQFDTFRLTLMYNPVLSNYFVYCFDPESPCMHLHEKIVVLRHRPYHRLLVWRARYCLQENSFRFSDSNEFNRVLQLCDFSDTSQSAANAASSASGASSSAVASAVGDDEKF